MSDDDLLDAADDDYVDDDDEPELLEEPGGSVDIEEDHIDLKEKGGVSKQHSFDVLTEEAVLKDSKRLIEGVMEFLGIPNRAIAACLLRAYK